MSMEQFFTVEETAVMLGKEPRQIYQWLALGELTGYQRKGRKSRWEIPASSLKPLLPGKLRERDRLILDLIGELRVMEEAAEGRLLQELMVRMADRLQPESEDEERSLQKKQACRSAGLITADTPGWEVLALFDLIDKMRSGGITKEAGYQILTDNDWVVWYEHMTNELVCTPAPFPQEELEEVL
ncbi:hypothetical protein [Paenibacillus mucilaginosus]|uniref:Helix-turn-helix domain-containing protein n=1 Tax=Paenibacillus mucilaginosus (strain KNP414) TaxID=1036673 RepID=F8FB66_PAEMK|nr:hypothetical protein [Paenibacillus mucilaginosus]AEI41709.1 hypothetical protein KNP414_03151 [Paenibacillus mucilaginosus KNP414]MCG7214401.1 hypothetical protein [Paenibacillus mucilaginosus]WDM30687.1 hypothetical protein KCX80_16680 [Paenibacillus mucilaginosus]